MRLKDIADEVGVSISTVSRVLSGKNIHAAGPALRDRILEIANQHDYTQNTAAQALQRRSKPEGPDTKVIACVFARTPLKDAFFMQMSRSMTEVFLRQSCIVKYTFALQELSSATVLDIFAENHLDGVVVLGRCEPDFMDQLYRLVKNVIYVGLNQTEIKYDQVVCDGFHAGVSAVRQLYELGHRKIGYIGEVHHEIRFNAYRHFMEHTPKLALDKSRIADVILSVEGGYAGLKQLMKRAPDTTGVFCANDTTAMGALRACRELGLDVFRDISLIGVDDLETSRYLSPMLSTVHIPISEMGEMAAKMLLDRINRGHTSPANISFSSRLVLRESCGKPRPMML